MEKITKKEQEKIDIINFQRQRAFDRNIDNVSILMKKMWELRDVTSKIFSEMEMYLAMNNPSENIKMKKGLETVANTLIESGNKIKLYIKEKKEIELKADDLI